MKEISKIIISATTEEAIEAVLITGAIEIHLVAEIEEEVVGIPLETIEGDLGSPLEIGEDIEIHMGATEGIETETEEAGVVIEEDLATGAVLGVEGDEEAIEGAEEVIEGLEEGVEEVIEGLEVVTEVDSARETVLDQNLLRTRK